MNINLCHVGLSEDIKLIRFKTEHFLSELPIWMLHGSSV